MTLQLVRTFLIAYFPVSLARARQLATGNTLSFNDDWRFNLGDIPDGQNPQLDDSQWRSLDLPHDWSIEGEFSEKNPATPGGGALPGGTGWYRKTFTVSSAVKGKLIFVDFDGVYRTRSSQRAVPGKRPYGAFRFAMNSPISNWAARRTSLR
jgi:beta-galactosidase